MMETYTIPFSMAVKLTRRLPGLTIILAVGVFTFTQPNYASADGNLGQVPPTLRAADFDEGISCTVQLRVYDPVPISYLVVQDGWFGPSCYSPIEGVSVNPHPSHGTRQELAGFPEDFVGPAALLVCSIVHPSHSCQESSLDQANENFGVVVALDANAESIPSLTVCPVHYECDEYCATGDAGPYVAGICGDADGNQSVTATDALVVLRAAVLLGECRPEQCDTEDDGDTDSTDALRILARAVSSDIILRCPPPCAAESISGRL